MPKVKLASTKLNPGSVSGRLNAVQFSGSRGAGISAPSINPNAGNVKYTPMPVPKIQDSPLAVGLAGAAGLSSTLENAAFRYEERQAVFTASEVSMDYSNELNSMFHGATDAQGNHKPGYSSLQGTEANEAYQDYVASVNQGFDKRIAALEPRVKQKATIALNRDRNTALQKAAAHNARQFDVAEQQQHYKRNTELMSDISMNGTEPWGSGKVTESVMAYRTLEEQHNAYETLGKHTVYTTYNKTLAATQDPMSAASAARAAYNDVARYQGPEGKNALDHWLMGIEKGAITETKKRHKEARTNAQNEIKRDAPTDYAKNMTTGNEGFIVDTVQTIRDTFDPDDQTKEVISAVTGAFDIIVANPDLMTYPDKMAAVDRHLERLMDASSQSEGGGFTQEEIIGITNHAQATLSSRLYTQQNNKDRTYESERLAEIQNATSENRMPRLGAFPVDMLPGNKQQLIDAEKKSMRLMAEGVPGYLRENRAAVGNHYSNIATYRTLTSNEVDQMTTLARDGKMDANTYRDLLRANQEMKSLGGRQPKYTQDAGYVGTSTKIKALTGLGGYTRTEAPDKDPENMEYAQWKAENEMGEHQAMADMKRAAKRAIIEGKSFDYDSWWETYVKTYINAGKPTSSSVWGDIKGAVGYAFGGGAAMDINDSVYHFMTGKGTVMEDKYAPPSTEPIPMLGP